MLGKIREVYSGFAESAGVEWGKSFLTAIRVYWVSFVFSWIVAYLLVTVDQVHEANRAIAASPLTSAPWYLATLATGFFGFMCWFWARAMMSGLANIGKRKALEGMERASENRFFRETVPVILGVVPVIAFAVSLLRSRVGRDPMLAAVNQHLLLWVGVVLAWSGLVLWASMRFNKAVFAVLPKSRDQGPGENTWESSGEKQDKAGRMIRIVAYVVLVLLATGAMMFVFVPAGWGEICGPIATLLFGISTWIALLSYFVYRARKDRFPYLWIPLVLILGKGLMNSDGHHEVVLLTRPPVVEQDDSKPGQPGPKWYPDDLRAAFRHWYAARPDRAYYEKLKKPYPVVIVYAQGGGIRAAIHSLLTLSSVQDLCPAFTQHVFAISGVSGGSLGTTLFAALAKEHPVKVEDPVYRPDPPAEGSFLQMARKVTSHDLLSPILGRWLFADVLAAALPFAVSDFDRSKALSAALENAWACDCTAPGNRNVLAERLSGLYVDDEGKDTFAGGSVPSLFLNTTSSTDGRPFVLSYHRFRTEADRSFEAGLAKPRNSQVVDQPLRTFYDIEPTMDLKLSDAAGLSARFPVITSSGLIRGQKGGRTIEERFVDGGYYDNAGATTVVAILNEIADIARVNNIEFILVRVGADLSENPARPAPQAFSDSFSPLYTAFGSFSAQNSASLSTLNSTIEGIRLRHPVSAEEMLLNQVRATATNAILSAINSDQKIDPRDLDLPLPITQIDFIYRTERVPLVLGWYFSKPAIEELIAQLGKPRNLTLDRTHDLTAVRYNSASMYALFAKLGLAGFGDPP